MITQRDAPAVWASPDPLHGIADHSRRLFAHRIDADTCADRYRGAMRVHVLLVSQYHFVAVEPVLAELDEARRALAPSGVHLVATLVGEPQPHVRRAALATAGHLGLQLDIISIAEPAMVAGLRAGLTHAQGDRPVAIVSLDADGQHDARQIPDLLRSHLARGSGLTIGSRWTRGGSSPGTGVVRSVLSRIGNAATKLATGARGVSDSTTSFRVYHPDLAHLLVGEPLPDEPHGFFSATVAVAQAYGFAVDEVPIVFRPRYTSGSVGGDDLREFVSSLLPVRRHVRSIRRSMRSNQALWAQRSPRLRAQAATGESLFAATEELGNLADAHRFNAWIVDELAPHLGHHVLEVGAGVGAIAVRIAARGHRVTALEPADNVYPDLLRRTADESAVEVLPITSQQLLATRTAEQFDSVVYVSVLEHIRDDVAELGTAYSLLRPGGTLGIFVPAAPWLYGSLDYKSGHYRRYDRPLLRQAISDAGFELVDMHYFDVAGVLPYLLMYRVLDVKSLDSGSSAVYDRLIVPVSRVIQRCIPSPAFGKNLVAIARRPDIDR
jgi:SAM-dependent methyltransferase